MGLDTPVVSGRNVVAKEGVEAAIELSAIAVFETFEQLTRPTARLSCFLQ